MELMKLRRECSLVLPGLPGFPVSPLLSVTSAFVCLRRWFPPTDGGEGSASMFECRSTFLLVWAEKAETTKLATVPGGIWEGQGNQDCPHWVGQPTTVCVLVVVVGEGGLRITASVSLVWA